MIKKQFNKKGSAFSTFFMAALIVVVFTTLVVVSANALIGTTHPTIVSVSPANNQEGVLTNEKIEVVFSEDMDPSTINANTFIVMQRTTPESGGYRSIAINEPVTYTGRTATFKPTYGVFSPNQQYGNVFTVTITTGAKDLAGNSLLQNYVWSFTTGSDPFNIGATTSQQYPNAAPISGSVATSPSSTQPLLAATPITGTQTAKASDFPWVWAIGGGLLLLLLVASIFVFAKKPERQKNIHAAARPSPFGDVHPVMDLEGIGPEYNKELHAMGIKNTKQLWETDAIQVARETGAPLSSVKSWQHMAELATVKDIGPQYAELLERSGIHTIGQLKNYNPNELLKLVRKKQDSLKVNIQGNSPGYSTVEHWIDEANVHEFNDAEVGRIA